MNQDEIAALISGLVNEYRRLNRLEPIEVPPDAMLLDGSLGIDSLDLASIVVELEETTGLDPFSDGIVNFQTAGELARLYSVR